MTNDSIHADVRTDFIEKTGLVAQADGMPRIAGRIFGMLIYDGNDVSFGDLATKLQVSRASISTSIRILEERGLVRRLTKPGERQDFFQLAPNPYATMLDCILKRNHSIKADIAQTIERLPADADAVGRLTAHAHFYDTVDKSIALALSELNAFTNPTKGQTPAAFKDDPDGK